MTIHRSTLRKFAYSALLLVLPLNPAFAADTKAVAERLKASFENQGVTLAWTGVSGDTSSMVLEGVTIAPAGDKEPLKIGNVTFKNVTDANGGYLVDTVSTEAFTQEKDGAKFEMSPFTINGMTIPGEGNTDPVASLLMYKSAQLDNLSVKIGDKTAFSVANVNVDIVPPADGKAMTFTGGAEKFTGDLSLVQDPDSKAVIDGLGYQNVSGKLDMAGSWEPKDGKMDLSKYDITVDNAGTLGMSFSLGGYTTEFIKSLQQLQKKMAASPEGVDKSAEGMAVLGLMQQLTFNSASIRFADNSLTNKVLEFVAKKQGTQPKDIANQAKAIVPFGMAQINNPELTAQVTKAVSDYLDNPQNLVIAAKPASPVPFALIAAGAMASPADLTKTLGVTVTANGN
ncbi:hypothetical protein [Mesorhizobium retamae]|uniref:DUF945 domain-containing protein n=1 Tax=Mesorhizobium retamae TaxID=2912854 RepID=A0ABS9QE93_9HYPH|nr:hypothetical protein [Mesorhizobium sp. IRAMC:0171]MCG7505741.1 hypothetical protein [Mesorhizobium sp. IRAMC:0171]